jgi:ribosomal protein S2
MNISIYGKKKEKRIKNKTFLSNKNPVNAKLLNNLFISKNHLGHLLTQIPPEISVFLYGTRFKQGVIDLNLTIHNLQRCFSLLTQLMRGNKALYYSKGKSRILFVCHDERFKNLNNLLNQRYCYLFSQAWKPGYITKKLRKVDLVVCLSSDGVVEKEAFLKKIPVVSLVDTNTKSLNLIHYPLVSNTTSIQSVFFIIFLFQRFFDNFQFKK